MNKSSILAEPINKTNVLIEISDHAKKDYLLLIEGKVFIKNYILETNNLFDQALEDFYDGTLHLFPGIENKDFEGKYFYKG